MVLFFKGDFYMQIIGYKLINTNDKSLDLANVITSTNIYHSIFIPLSGSLSFITENGSFSLSKGTIALFEPFSFKKIYPEDECSCFIINVFFQTSCLRIESGKCGNAVFNSFHPNSWGIQHTSMALGSDHFLPKYQQGDFYQAVKFSFDRISIKNINKVSCSFYPAFKGVVYAFWANETDFSPKNAVAFKKLSQLSYNTITLSPRAIAIGDYIDGLILSFIPKTEGQVFVGKIDLYYNNHGTFSLTTSKNNENERFIKIFHNQVFDYSNNKFLQQTVNKLLYYYNEFDSEARDSLIECSLTQGLYEMEKMADFNSVKIKKFHSNKTIQDILAYIDKNLYTKITLEDISAHLNLTPKHLAKLFKNTMNKSIMSYVRDKQLTFAYQMISQGVPPSEVFYQFGYADYSTFYRAFKKHFGHNPVSTPILNK